MRGCKILGDAFHFDYRRHGHILYVKPRGWDPGVSFHTMTIRLLREQCNTFRTIRRERIADFVFTAEDLLAPFFHELLDLRNLCRHIGGALGLKGGRALIPGKTSEAFLQTTTL